MLDEETRIGRLGLALVSVAIVAACTGIESLLDRPWVYPVNIVHAIAGFMALVFLISAALGPRIAPWNDDDDPRPWDVG